MNSASAIQLLQFIFGLAVLIVLHEFGHFIACRIFKVEVEEFGIGFPPRLVKLFDAGGTEFTLNAIPLGGFVRPKGENDPDVPGGLAAANPWARLVVLAAGPLMNLLAGIILAVILAYSMGEPVLDKVLIQAVALNSPAAAAGLQPGDMILKVNDTPIDSIDGLIKVVGQNLGQPVQLFIQRAGQTQTVALTPRASPPPKEGAIGIVLSNPTRPTTLGKAVWYGAYAAYQNGRGILLLPLRMVQGQASAQETRLVGYKGLFDVYQQIQSPLLFFMAISISLGIINLFPIPALDGGRILLTLPEIVLRRRIPPQYENMIHLVGFALLLILIIYINVQDFINPIQFSK